MLSSLSSPVRAEFERFERLYREALRTPVQEIEPLYSFLSASEGKHIRPLVLLLSAKLCGGVPEEALRYAVVIELLHTATLIHDDVVDDTRQRRGQPSVMAKFGNRRAVLLGDYVLSQAILLGVDTRNMYIIDLLARLAQQLVEGELSQLAAAAEPCFDEEAYFEVIRKKTAILLSASAELGALSAGANAGATQRLQTVGNHIGLCFQLKDDLFDYYPAATIGKPTGNDIRAGRVTLPLIYALRSAPASVAAPMRNIIEQKAFTPHNCRRLIVFSKRYDGIEYTYRKMRELRVETLRLLSPFPDSEAKESLNEMIDYIIGRNR
jgi:octaprenyl-diphosphate synthase